MKSEIKTDFILKWIVHWSKVIVNSLISNWEPELCSTIMIYRYDIFIIVAEKCLGTIRCQDIFYIIDDSGYFVCMFVYFFQMIFFMQPPSTYIFQSLLTLKRLGHFFSKCNFIF